MPCLCTCSTHGSCASEAASTCCMAFIWERPDFTQVHFSGPSEQPQLFVRFPLYSTSTRQVIFTTSWYTSEEQINTSLFLHGFTKPNTFLDWENWQKAVTLNPWYWGSVLRSRLYFLVCLSTQLKQNKGPTKTNWIMGEWINRASDALLTCTKREKDGNDLAVLQICPSLNQLTGIWVGWCGYLPEL